MFGLDPVHAVCRLVFHSGIPPHVVVDDSVGTCEVKARSTGFEADGNMGMVASSLNSLTIPILFFLLPSRYENLMPRRWKVLTYNLQADTVCTG